MTTANKSDDSALVYAALADPEAFGTLMRRYEQPLLRYVRRILGCTREDAEEVVQETFIKAYENLNDFDTDLAFSSWIYRIAHNTAVSAWRKARVRPHGNAVDVDDEALARLVADEDIVRTVDHRLLRERVATVIERMDEKYRTVLVLRYMEDMDYGAIADITQKPIGTVATLLNRAKKRFHTLYIEDYRSTL